GFIHDAAGPTCAVERVTHAVVDRLVPVRYIASESSSSARGSEPRVGRSCPSRKGLTEVRRLPKSTRRRKQIDRVRVSWIRQDRAHATAIHHVQRDAVLNMIGLGGPERLPDWRSGRSMAAGKQGATVDLLLLLGLTGDRLH